MSPAEFKQIRIDLGMSQSEFAAFLSISDQTVRQYEYGSRKVFEPVAELLKLKLSNLGETKK